MKKKVPLAEADLAATAKQYRLAAGKTRAQAAREMNVAPPAIIYAEDHPHKSFLKLRKRMIEMYSPYTVAGPEFWLKRKQR